VRPARWAFREKIAIQVSTVNDRGIPVGGAEVYEQVFGPAMLGEWASRGASLADSHPGEHVLDGVHIRSK
jgi:hypothetical protein